MLYTMPWYCKGMVIAYDVFKCFLLRRRPAEPTVETSQTFETFESTTGVFGVQAMIVLLLLAPSLVLSVQDRVKTSLFCGHMLLLLSTYLLLIRAMRAGHVSAEHICFVLQFGSCHMFCFFYENSQRRRKVLVGSSAVALTSLACLFAFPLLYSHMLQNCMHVSPYALGFVFSGEICGCIAFCVSHVLCAVECVFDAAYTRLLG